MSLLCKSRNSWGEGVYFYYSHHEMVPEDSKVTVRYSENLYVIESSLHARPK